MDAGRGGRVTERVAVVTGASSGLGEGLARALRARGWSLVLLARREDRLRALAEELGCAYEVCDVAEREQVEAVAARHPHVSLLVNNAGIAARREFLDSDPERIEQVTRVNYLGGVWCTRAFLPALEAARPSTVVHVVSVAGAVAFPPSGPYTAAKHAQLAFARATAPRLARRGIGTLTVLPGFFVTEGFPQDDLRSVPLLGRMVGGPEPVVGRMVRAIESGRRGELVVPWWYRAAIVAQALLPGLVSAIGARVPFRG
jgi:NAD(P)-dependent dehydrogenase (short-subunit alcohol dehydrogenase family)